MLIPIALRAFASLIAVCALAAAVTPADANAGLYVVRQCEPDLGIFSHELAWAGQGTPAIEQYPGSACTEFGLAARTTNRGVVQDYSGAAFGAYVAVAPADTLFRSFSGYFGTRSECCVSGLVARARVAQFADGSGYQEQIFAGHLGDASWLAEAGTEGPTSQSWTEPPFSTGAQRIEYGLYCASTVCEQDTNGLGAVRARSFAFEMDDLAPPSIDQVGGALVSTGWQRGERAVTVEAADDGGGIAAVDARIVGGELEREAAIACAEVGGTFTSLQPCPLATDVSWPIDTREIPDGEHVLEISATDVGGERTRMEVPISIDNTAPAAPLGVGLSGPETWRSTRDFTLRWEASAEAQYAPLTRVRYEVCRLDPPSSCTADDQPHNALNELTVSLSDVGRYGVRLGFEDGAGNFAASSWSDMIELKFDDHAPGKAWAAVPAGWLGVANTVAPLVLGLDDETTRPLSGIAGYSVTADGTTPDAVPEWAEDQEELALGTLPEGTTTLAVRAVSGAGIGADEVDFIDVRIDRTPPVVEAGGSGEGWATAGVEIPLVAADQVGLSGMEGSAAGEPVEDGGFLEYSVGDGPVRRERGPEAVVAVGEDGVHAIRFRAVDVAGNSSLEKEVRVKVDTTAPTGGFELQDPADPRRLSAIVQDQASGVAGGRIEYRNGESGAFTPLPTTLADGRLTALVDDLALGRGRYEFRAVVWDVAGNQASLGARVDGRPMTLALPVRLATQAQARLVARKGKCRKRGRRSGRARVRASKRRCARRTRRVGVLRYGRRVISQGRLMTSQGAPIAGAPVVAEGRPRGRKSFAPLGTVRTNATGRFRFRVPRGPSRTVRYRFAGSPTLQPATVEVRTRVRAAATLKVDRRRLRNGQAVRFRGRLRGRPLPAAGKLVALQARVGREWRTFATPRANRRGVFRHRYRFTATTGLRRYAFRALVTRESAYPYERGRSRVVRVTVRGR